jgi:hypothetical protein
MSKRRRRRQRTDGPGTLSVLADISRILGTVFVVAYHVIRDLLI